MTLIQDLHTRFRLYAVCSGCRRMVALPLDELLARLGPTATVSDIRQRVRCHDCGQRTRDVRIVYVGPCASAAGFHYRG